MNDENRKWDSLFLGVLEERNLKNIYATSTNSIRFSITLKSTTPGDFPQDTKEVNGFSDSLKLFGDSKDLLEEERVKILIEFLKDYILVFKVKEEKHREYNKYYYNAYDIELIKKETADTSIRYIPVPIVEVYSDSLKSMLNKISNNEFIQDIKGISNHKDDTPYFVLVKEEEKNKNHTLLQQSAGENNYLAVGPVEDLGYSEEYGHKFHAYNEKKYVELENNDIEKIYFTSSSVVFVPLLIEEKIASYIDKSERNIGVSKEIMKLEDQDENKFIDVFRDVAILKGLNYDINDLINFHTAMKTQSFVILAGMSGTGKSQIVQCYHEALNKYANGNIKIEERKGSKLLFVPVRPFWQDDSDLLGYLDTLNGIYRPGESGLVDFIYQSQENPDECYIVCLDEMNLARVEHYFSQFLSILEREPSKRIIRLYNENLHGRVYNQNDYPTELKLGENLFFVGTVNIDESTFQFSDKVLDRANVINLKLNSFKNARQVISQREAELKNQTTPRGKDLVTEDLRTYVKFKGMQKEDKDKMLSPEELDLLWEIHLQINKINPKLGVGYRIVNQIESYIMNIPNNKHLKRENALDLQVSQRILTKLRGSDIQLNGLVGNFEDGQFFAGTLYKLLEDNKSLSTFTTSLEKLRFLAQELNEYGYAF